MAALSFESRLKTVPSAIGGPGSGLRHDCRSSATNTTGTDIHATILHQLGLDSRLLEVPGRQRLDIDHGKPIYEILA